MLRNMLKSLFGSSRSAWNAANKTMSSRHGRLTVTGGVMFSYKAAKKAASPLKAGTM